MRSREMADFKIVKLIDKMKNKNSNKSFLVLFLNNHAAPNHSEKVI